ncbi:MAG: caspase family protein [Elusimicrobia bacterium]|nr:caspase family protein [Elusimicrobiota bacterium]
MNSRYLALAALPLALLLSSCATAPMSGGSTMGGGLGGRMAGGDQGMGAATDCSTFLRACMKQPPGMLNSVRISHLRGFFASAIHKADPTAADCDLLFDYPATFSDRADVYSVYTGQLLTRLTAANSMINARAACAIFSDESGAAYQAIPAEKVADRRPRKASPEAASGGGGLSTADIDRIAKAVQGAAPAAPPAAPAASYPASPAPRFSAAERPDDLAVIVGIESYSDIASKASYAERDADAFKAHVRALGVPERNIVLLKGPKAGKASLVKNLEAWLPRMAKADSRVYFYFSGHGAPDVKTGQAYLVPWDGDPNFLDVTAYPVAKLYKKLGELPAKQVLVAMDSCFSGAGGRSVLASGARPLVGRIDTGAAPAKITVLAASAANEISGSLDEKGHGAFTYFLLEGLNAGKTTPKALNEYLTPRVQDEARRLNRDQTPQLQGDGAWSLR